MLESGLAVKVTNFNDTMSEKVDELTVNMREKI
jgi:hypothetical protein